LEAIIKSGGNFQGDCEVNQRVVHLHGKAKKTYFEKFENYEAVTDETFSLQIATSWRVVIMLKIYCQGLCLRSTVLPRVLANLRRHSH